MDIVLFNLRHCHLRDGDITNLRVDAIVNPTNETLDDKNTISTRIHTVAGPDLMETCKKELKGRFLTLVLRDIA